MKLKEFKADLNPNSKIHNFSAHKKIINKLLVGNFESDLKNRGMEFEDYRKYTQSDDSRQIDWKASLRTNQILIRESIEEKAVNVMFLVDVSDSMLFSSSEKLKCEYAAEIVCGLSFAIQREGNAIGLCLFNEKIVKSLPPKIGTRQYLDMMREISRATNYGGKANLKNAMKHCLSLMKSPCLLIIISDFIDIGDDWEHFLQIVSLKYLILGLDIKDIRDRIIPKNIGFFVIEDPSSNDKIVFDTKEFYEKYENEVKKNEENIVKGFKKAKSMCINLQTNEDFFNPIIRYLEKRLNIIK